MQEQPRTYFLGLQLFAWTALKGQEYTNWSARLAFSFQRFAGRAGADPHFKLCGFFGARLSAQTNKTGPRYTRSEVRLSFPERKKYTSRMQRLTLPVILESDQNGYFVSCPALQGCYSQGETYEEAMANIKDAMRLHLEDRLANGEEFPEAVSVSLSTVEVSV